MNLEDRSFTVQVGDEELYYKLVLIGGKDKQGVYELVLDGPAQGEKAYV